MLRLHAIQQVLFCFVFLQRLLKIYTTLSTKVYEKLSQSIPGFTTVMEKVNADATAREKKRKEKRMLEKKAEQERELIRRIAGDQ